MAKFLVRYYECYEGYYEVEANSKEEAEEILKQKLYTGEENAPDTCFDSGAEATEITC
jgi:hypothetical protein